MRRRGVKVPIGMFGTEAELCEKFIAVARDYCHVHAEVSDWDILLVRPSTGEQIGIQAKLRPNLEVIGQALRQYDASKQAGPDIRAVLVPGTNHVFNRVARECHLHVFSGEFAKPAHIQAAFEGAPRWPFKEREWVPSNEVSTAAGVASPKKTTKWKLAAVELCLLARRKGFVTAIDLKALKLDPKWWFDYRFGPVLLPTGERGKYKLNPAAHSPDLRYPEVVGAIVGEQRLVAEFAEQLKRERSYPLRRRVLPQ